MKNLSNVDIHDFLSRCQGSRVENRNVEYDGKSYAIPYSTVKIQGSLINGLRENEERIQLFKDIILEDKGDKTSYLDIGCNLGVFVKSFSYIFDQVSGLDADSYYIEMCNFLYQELSQSFILANINNNRLADLFHQQFDVITALSMIEYITDKRGFVDDLFSLTKSLCIIEGHSEDIYKGYDKFYEGLLEEKPWSVERLGVLTDAGVNAPDHSQGRPVWVCRK